VVVTGTGAEVVGRRPVPLPQKTRAAYRGYRHPLSLEAVLYYVPTPESLAKGKQTIAHCTKRKGCVATIEFQIIADIA
jgi:hypothetical protein